MAESKRWKEIDALYTMGIILVLIGHSHSSDWSAIQGTAWEKGIYFIYTFHMPLFYFVSGFLFQNSGALLIKGYKHWLCDKALRLLTPYFFWSFAAVVPKYYLEHKSFAGIGTAIAAIFINPRASVWGHFWFVPVIFLTYAIFGLVRSLGKDDSKTMLSALAAAAIIYFLPIQSDLFGLSDLRSSLLFFAFGGVFCLALEKTRLLRRLKCGVFLRVSYCVAATISCFLLTDAAVKNPVIGLAVAILMLSVCWIVARRIDVGTWFSSHNFTIYIFSWFFQSAAMVLCGRLNLLYTFLIMFSAGLCGPLALIFLFESLPFLHKRWIKCILGMR